MCIWTYICIHSISCILSILDEVCVSVCMHTVTATKGRAWYLSDAGKRITKWNLIGFGKAEMSLIRILVKVIENWTSKIWMVGKKKVYFIRKQTWYKNSQLKAGQQVREPIGKDQGNKLNEKPHSVPRVFLFYVFHFFINYYWILIKI